MQCEFHRKEIIPLFLRLALEVYNVLDHNFHFHVGVVHISRQMTWGKGGTTKSDCIVNGELTNHLMTGEGG